MAETIVTKADSDAADHLALEKCIEFLNSIGIKTSFGKIEGECFLPGLSIEQGCIIIDKEKLRYSGDILHEAGHIAVVSSTERATLDAASIGQRKDQEAEEMMAIAWSYAACIRIGFHPYFVFHDKGYKGGGSYIADNFSEKRYFGLPMLQWKGMAMDEKNAVAAGVKPYPNMVKWMLD